MFKFIQQIKHSIYWRCVHHYYAVGNFYAVRDFIRSYWAQVCVVWHWYFKSVGRPHNLQHSLIVSLTSYPPRFGTLAFTLRSLLRQTVKADRTILWIAHADMPLLPKEVTDLQKYGLEIRATEDVKPYKKILPALDAFSDAFICTADDDLYYWPTWLEKLIEETSTTERIVTCHRAIEITFNRQGKCNSYNQWLIDTHKRMKSKWLFPTGIGGILYPPGILAHTAEDRQAALKLCPHADDVWLYWMGRRNGAIYKTVDRWHDLITWYGSQDRGLWHYNVTQGGNNIQIGKMVERYGYPT